MTEEDVMKVPGEIPIIEKRQTSSGQLRPSSAGKVVPSKSVSAKKDASIVLSYLKKNMYDDTRKYCLGYSKFRYMARTLYSTIIVSENHTSPVLIL